MGEKLLGKAYDFSYFVVKKKVLATAKVIKPSLCWSFVCLVLKGMCN